MKNLNPLLVAPALKETKMENTEIKRSEKVREVRSDKKDDVKFPVTEEMLTALTRRVRELSKRTREQVHMTDYNSRLLAYGLKKDPNFFEPIEYVDTKKYKHAKMIQIYSDQLFELTMRWQCSKREAVFRIISNLVKKGELL